MELRQFQVAGIGCWGSVGKARYVSVYKNRRRWRRRRFWRPLRGIIGDLLTLPGRIQVEREGPFLLGVSGRGDFFLRPTCPQCPISKISAKLVKSRSACARGVNV